LRSLLSIDFLHCYERIWQPKTTWKHREVFVATASTLSSGLPTPLKAVPYFNLAPIENAVARLKASAKTYDAALDAKGAALPAAKKAKLVELAGRTEQALLMEPGLPGGRGWYKNMIYAPGRLTGYGAKTLPGVHLLLLRVVNPRAFNASAISERGLSWIIISSMTTRASFSTMSCSSRKQSSEIFRP